MAKKKIRKKAPKKKDKKYVALVECAHLMCITVTAPSLKEAKVLAEKEAEDQEANQNTECRKLPPKVRELTELKLKEYTVIGLYRDNNQPWMDTVEAYNPQEAAKDIPPGISVVEVIEGVHQGILDNKECLDPLEEKEEESDDSGS